MMIDIIIHRNIDYMSSWIFFVYNNIFISLIYVYTLYKMYEKYIKIMFFIQNENYTV